MSAIRWKSRKYRKAAKNLMRKPMEEHSDPCLALLELRNQKYDEKNHGRALRSILGSLITVKHTVQKHEQFTKPKIVW